MSAGVRSHLIDCPICGRRYRRTNLMLRWVHPETLDVHRREQSGPLRYAPREYRQIDTHSLAHWRNGWRDCRECHRQRKRKP